MDNEVELTELVDLAVERHDGVERPASGFRFLVTKAAADPNTTGCGCCEACNAGMAKDVNAVGGIDEQPDIDGARQVLCQLYRLIEAEAREGAVGADEASDIQCLSEAICLVRYFLMCEEMGGQEDDGSGIAKSAALAELDEFVVAKAHRKFSSDERKRLASEDKALPDGSYPIPDADALRRAAILARSGHGDVAAAKRLIARRAKELGVKNPLDNDAKKDAPEVTEGTVETSEVEDTAKSETEATSVTKAEIDALSQRVEKMESALAEASKRAEDAEAREGATKAELEALKATPIPGGPVLAATEQDRAFKAKNEAIKKAAYHKRQAENTNDRDLIKYHVAKAAEYEAAAK